MRGKCESCEFFEPVRTWESALEDGESYSLPSSCHIRSVDNDAWPERESYDWCGEWQEREELVAEREVAAIQREEEMTRALNKPRRLSGFFG